MADLAQLLRSAFVEVFAHGRLPPEDLLKALISKVGVRRRVIVFRTHSCWVPGRWGGK